MHRAVLRGCFMNVAGYATPLLLAAAFSPFTLLSAPVTGDFRLPSNGLYRYEEGAGVDSGRAVVFESRTPCGTGCPSMNLDLQPGCRYAFSALVKAGDAKDAVMQLMLEWRDANGRRLGSAYGNPVNDNEVLPDGWLRYGGMTQPVKEGVKSASLHFYVAKGGSGRVVFDRFDLTRLESYSVGPLLSSAYRNVATGGIVRFVAPLHRFEDLKVDAGSFKPEFSYRGADGGMRTVRPGKFSLDRAEISLDVGSMAAGTHPVSFSLSAKGRSYGTAELKFTRAARLPGRKVWIDPKRRLIVDGKPYFMLGMYWRKITEEELDAFCPSPFNTVLPCQRPERWQFDLCERRGLKMCYPFEHRYDVPGESTNVVRIVKELRDHPALLLWYLNDERPVSMVKQVTARHDLVVSLDDQHPTWTMSDKPVNVKSFLGSYEIIGADAYPIGNALPGHPFPIENVLKYARTARECSYGLYPLWHVPQAFSWGWFRKGRKDFIDMRYPTREEIRQMTWQYIAGGANGIIYYSFNTLRDNLKGSAFDGKWNELKEIAAEVKSFEDVFLTEEDAPVVTGMTASVGARAWRYGGDVWLLAVNATRNPQKVSLSLDCSVSADMKRIFGTPPVRKDARTFGYSLKPLECVFVRMAEKRVL